MRAAGTHLTSLGVPERLSRRTTACGPPASSNERSAGDESTRMQERVSRTMEVRVWDFGSASLREVGM